MFQEQFLSKSKRNQILIYIIVFVALLGLLDATYISVSTLRGSSLICGSLGDCTGVTTSAYSRLFGIPVAYLGFLYYTLFFFASLTVATFKKSTLIVPLFILSITGLVASIWFVFAQLVLLKSVCVYCMFSATTSTSLFILTLILQKRFKKTYSSLPSDSTESVQV